VKHVKENTTMARRTEVAWGEFSHKLEPQAKDEQAVPTSVKQWLQWLSGEVTAALAQGVYVGISFTSLGDLAVTLVNDGSREKIYLEATEAIGEQGAQLREALGAVTRQASRRRR
jgi:hypothetical protein